MSLATTCAARAVCPLVGRNCNESCVAYRELQRQLTASAIPPRYQTASVSEVAALLKSENRGASEFVGGWGGDVLENVAAGRGLYLVSKTTGNGKTTSAGALARDYIVLSAMKTVWGDLQPVNRLLAYFLDVPTFLDDCKVMYGDEEAKARVELMMRRSLEADLLVLDDIGAGKNTQSVLDKLMRIINERLNREKSIIATSNLPLGELEAMFSAQDPTQGRRIASRISGACVTVAFGGSDKRRRGA
jgi:DNA replication protein DnaC